jgi:hypothetical protein
MKKVLLIAGISLSLNLGAHADVIYQDDFNRTGALNGSFPTVPGNVAWSETDANSTTGTITTNGSAAIFDATSDSTAALPITITAGTDYYAQITLDVATGTSGNWAAVGFTRLTPHMSATFNSNSPVLWALETDNGTALALAPSGNTSNAASGSDTFTFLLTAGAVSGTENYSITDTQGLSTTGTLTAQDVSSITGFDIGNNLGGNDVSASFSALTIGTGSLPTTPEPSATALVLVGFFGLVTLLRFRKTAK